MTTRIEVKRNYFNVQDLSIFLASARDARELLWWLLMCDSGLRMAELRSLHWGDVWGESLNVIGKGKKRRAVPLTKRTRDQIRRLRNLLSPKESALLCPITSRAVQARFHRCLKRSALDAKNRCPHSLRHTFATSLLVAGVDIHRVGVLLGHANTLTTTGYLHTDPRGLREAAASLDKLYEERGGDNGQAGAQADRVD